MTSSQPILYLKNLILMLVSWMERNSVSIWTHDPQGPTQVWLSLEFCNHCMCIISENRGCSPSPPCLEGFDRFPQLFLRFSMTLYEAGHSHQFGRQVKHLELVTELSHPILGSTVLLLPRWREELLDYIERWDSWHVEAIQARHEAKEEAIQVRRAEEAIQVQHSASRRSFKNRMSQRLRNTRRYISRAMRKRSLSRLRFCITT